MGQHLPVPPSHRNGTLHLESRCRSCLPWQTNLNPLNEEENFTILLQCILSKTFRVTGFLIQSNLHLELPNVKIIFFFVQPFPDLATPASTHAKVCERNGFQCAAQAKSSGFEFTTSAAWCRSFGEIQHQGATSKLANYRNLHGFNHNLVHIFVVSLAEM